MKETTIIQPSAILTTIGSTLLFIFVILSPVCLAQKDLERKAEDCPEQLYSVIKPWHFGNDGANAEVQFSARQKTPVTAEGNVAIIDRLYRAFAKGDVPGALANMHSEIVWNEAESFPYADRNPYIGPQAVLDGVFARIGAEWEYWNLADIELHEMANDKVLATLRYQAKYHKNGAEIDAQTAHFWTLKDGKITSFQQFTDTEQVMRAVGK